MHRFFHSCLLTALMAFAWAPTIAQDTSGLRSVPTSVARSLEAAGQADPSTSPAPLLVMPKADPAPAPSGRHQFFSPTSPDRRRSEKTMRYGEVQQALQNLLQEWEQSQASEPAPQQTNDDEGTPKPVADDERQPDPTATTSSETDPTSTQPEESDSAEMSAEDREALSRLNFPDDTLVDGPVDRVALADNLYAMGAFPLAMEMYSRVEMEQLPAPQQFWVQFQFASCHRQLGDLPAAKKQLRILAGQEEAGWLGQSARWWLDLIDDRLEMEKELAETQRQLNARMEKYRETKRR